MKPIKAYIAGKVSGMSITAVNQIFDAKTLELQVQGKYPINPVRLIEAVNKERQRINKPIWTDETHRNEIMRQCAIFLAGCDEIHLLPGWQESKGATIEWHIAQMLNIPIIYP